MKLLKEASKEIGLEITEEMCNDFFQYKEMLLEWNEKINLTSITEEREIILKHFVDSVSVLTLEEFKIENLKIIDVGTGAGFPAIPIKIMRRDINMTLLDSLNKRLSFLNNVIENLNFSDIECIHSRAEDLAKKTEYRETFDICVSRAVANLSALTEYCLPYVKLGGSFIAFKGNNVTEETHDASNAISVLGGKITNIKKIKIPFTDISHTLVVITKICETPNIYPRKSNQITKKPIS